MEADVLCFCPGVGPVDNKAGTMVIGYNAILRGLAKSTHPVSVNYTCINLLLGFVNLFEVEEKELMFIAI